MGKYDKLLRKILYGRADANIAFRDLCRLLHRLGFEERVWGSRHVFRKAGIEEKINLQKDGNKAKPYQVRQVRAVIVKYKLGDSNALGAFHLLKTWRREHSQMRPDGI